MAQRVLTGIMGNATGVPGRVCMWMGVRSFEDLDSTGLGMTERDREIGLGDFIGKIAVRLTDGTPADSFAAAFNGSVIATLVLTAATGDTFSFSALLSEAEISNVDTDAKKASMCTFTFKKKGALTITWATA